MNIYQLINIRSFKTFFILICFILIPSIKLQAISIDSNVVNDVNILFYDNSDYNREYRFKLDSSAKDYLIYLLNQSKTTEDLPMTELEEGYYIIEFLFNDRSSTSFLFEAPGLLYIKHEGLFYQNPYITNYIRLELIKFLLSKN